MKPTRVQFGALSLTLFLLASSTDVLAERLEQESISDSPWTFDAYIDGWLPKAPADIRIDGNDILLPENLNKILDSLKLAAMLRFNAHKGPLGFFVNPLFYIGTYDKIRIRLPFEEVDGKLDENVWWIDYGISYEIGRWDFGKDGKSRVVTLEPFAGFLFFHDNITITTEPGIIHPDGTATHKTVSTNSPIIGLKSSIQLNDNWDLRLLGDYGGFNVNKMNETYQMAGYFHYGFKMRKLNATAYFGYRFLHVDLKNKGESVEVSVDVKGPLLGIGFTF
jgi:hypothetical protein